MGFACNGTTPILKPTSVLVTFLRHPLAFRLARFTAMAAPSRLRKMLNWLASIGRQVLRAFGLGAKAQPFEWGVSVLPVVDRAPIDKLWWEQQFIVYQRGTKAAHPNPTGLRYGVYQGDRFPDGSTHWGKYWAHSRVIVVLKAHAGNTALWAHECRHDVLGTEDHPSPWFNGSDLRMP